jgi:hypothetical protein
MANLILLCEWLTARLPARIATTGLFTAGVSASGKTKARDRSPAAPVALHDSRKAAGAGSACGLVRCAGWRGIAGPPDCESTGALKVSPAPLPSKKRISFRSITIARLIPVPDYGRGRQLTRPFEGRKDGKAFAARLVGDGSLCVRRDGDSDRRPLLAVLDWRVTELGCRPTINPLRARSVQGIWRRHCASAQIDSHHGSS